jgi:hypothetical protein
MVETTRPREGGAADDVSEECFAVADDDAAVGALAGVLVAGLAAGADGMMRRTA